jgi:16S rRNA (guanine527-N7)-methyltransferase
VARDTPKARAEALAGLATAIRVLTGRPATASEILRFTRYLDLLVLWNRTQRLTGLRSAAEMVHHLFQDSLLFLARLPQGALRMVDIGAGAGIPGIPLGLIRPDIDVTLVESKRKRVSFLATVKRELDLSGVTVLEGRAEDLLRSQSSQLAGTFDVVITRAVGPLPTLLPTAMGYLRTGGMFLAAGPPAGTLTAGTLTGDAAGLLNRDVVRFPELGLERVFLFAIKHGT